MENETLTLIYSSILFGVFGSLIGAPILTISAKKIAGIENANFKNSFLICLLTLSVIYGGFWLILSDYSYDLGMWGMFFTNLVLLTALYTLFGKVIWKSTWLQSVKASSILILIFAIGMGYIINKVQEFMP